MHQTYVKDLVKHEPGFTDKAGSVHALKKRQDLIDACFDAFNPIEELIKCYGKCTANRDRVRILSQLCKYYAPQLQSITVDGQVQVPVSVAINTRPLPAIPENIARDVIEYGPQIEQDLSNNRRYE